jgi:hypothetical protein
MEACRRAALARERAINDNRVTVKANGTGAGLVCRLLFACMQLHGRMIEKTEGRPG